MAHVPVKLHGREVKPHKATRSPEFGSRTVLTNSAWEYVSLWLQRSNLQNALFLLVASTRVLDGITKPANCISAASSLLRVHECDQGPARFEGRRP